MDELDRSLTTQPQFENPDSHKLSAFWWRSTLPMSRTPTQRTSACFCLNDSGIARLASETITSARSTMYWARQSAANRSKVSCQSRRRCGRWRRACPRRRCGDRGPSEDLDGFPFDLIAQPRMKAIARRQVDRSLQAVLQDRLDVNQVKRIEPGRRLGFDEYIHVAAGAGCVP